MKKYEDLIDFFKGYVAALVDLYEGSYIEKEDFSHFLRESICDLIVEVLKRCKDGSSR